MRAYLLLGSNIGDREQFLRAARCALSEFGTLEQHSSVYETDSWGAVDQDPYLNQVIVLEASIDAFALHRATRDIERSMGRTGKGLRLPRTIDIDILFYSDHIIDNPTLTIPHPGIPERRFALIPLAELNAELVHPVLARTIQELLDACEDELEVRVWR